jgi:hypothetical protein
LEPSKWEESPEGRDNRQDNRQKKGPDSDDKAQS